MFDKTKMDLISAGRLLIVFCVAVVMAWFLVEQGDRAVSLALKAEKQMEIEQLYNAIAMYELRYGKNPENSNDPDWCIVGSTYEKKTCLLELKERGFFTETLPFSPDDIKQTPHLVNSFYSDAGYTKTDLKGFQRIYFNDYERWNGVSHFITKKYYFEIFAYWAKWPAPLLAILIAYMLIRWSKRQPNNSQC